MEWTNPQYAAMVEEIRHREATQPRAQCGRCQGRGTVFLPAAFGGTCVTCPPCDGQGTRPAPFRGFVMA